MDELELKKYLVEKVLAYGSKWNDFENYIYEQHIQERARLEEIRERERRKCTTPEQRSNVQVQQGVDWFEEFTRLISPLFDEYCTDKKRVYGGKKQCSIGSPPKYRGIEAPLETNVELKSKNRAEVHIKVKPVMELEINGYGEYLFVLLWKSKEWKIDSYKYKGSGWDKWLATLL